MASLVKQAKKSREAGQVPGLPADVEDIAAAKVDDQDDTEHGNSVIERG